MVNGPPCGVCGFTLRWLPQQNGWGCDRCQRMFPASGPGAPQQAATPPPQQPSPQQPSPQPPSPWAPPGQPGFTPPQQQGFAPPQQQGFKPPPQQGFAPPQQQGFAPPQQQGFAPQQPQNPYAPPQHGAPPPQHGAPPQQGYGQQPPYAQQPSPYAPPGATPQGAYPGHGPQQAYSPHPHGGGPQGPVGPVPVAGGGGGGKKGGKGLVIGLGVAGVAIAGGIIAFVMMRGGGAAKGGDSREAVIKSTLAAMGDGNVDQLLALADPVGLHDKIIDCSGKTKPRKDKDKDEDADAEKDDEEESQEDKDRKDPKKQREKMKEEFEKSAPKTKGAKIELVEIITKEPPVPSDDEKKKEDGDYDEDKEMSFLMKSGERAFKGCYTRVPVRLAEMKLKLKVTPPKADKATEQEAKIMMLQVGKGWYLMSPPRVSVGGAALAKEFSDMRDKVCACKDARCAEKLKDDFKSERSKEFKKEMKELPDDEKEKLDAIEEEIKTCEKKLAGEAQLEALVGFKDKICACADKSCADKVMQEMSVWSRSQDTDKISDETQKKATAVSEEMAKCMQKLYASGTGGGIGSTIADAAGGGDMPATCTEYKDFIGKLSQCSKFPESSRKALEDGFKAMEDGWKNIDWKTLPAESKKAMDDGCKQGLDAMKQSATAMGC